MSDQSYNQENSPEQQYEAQRQTAAGAQPQPSGQPNPLSNVDPQKLLGLLKNPTSSLGLQPAVDWIYGAIGAIVGVLGFWFFVWAIHHEVVPDVPSGADGLFDGLFNALGSIATAFDSPFFSLFSSLTPGEYFVLAILSIVVVGGALTLVGNWIGGRKRTWIEAATYYGATQLQTGIILLIAGIIAFMSLELAAFIGALVLLVSFVVLLLQALGLHEVSREKLFPYIYASSGAYAIVLYLVFKVLQ